MSDDSFRRSSFEKKISQEGEKAMDKILLVISSTDYLGNSWKKIGDALGFNKVWVASHIEARDVLRLSVLPHPTHILLIEDLGVLGERAARLFECRKIFQEIKDIAGADKKIVRCGWLEEESEDYIQLPFLVEKLKERFGL